MPNCIQFVQWREPGDDEDKLTMLAYPHGQESTDSLEDIREMFEIEKPENPENVDEEGCIIVPNNYVLWDGAAVEHKGRKFKVTITEITDAAP